MPGFSGSTSGNGNGIAARARGVRWTLGVVFAALALRLVHLQVVEHERYLELARNNILREEVLPAIRGVVRDRHRRILVDSVPSFTVALDPFDRAFLDRRASIENTLAVLEPIIGVPADSMSAMIEHEQTRSYRPVRLKRQVSVETVAYIEERRDRLPGVVVEVEPTRRHVHGRLAAHVLGCVGEVSGAEIGRTIGHRTYRAGDVIGRTGIERVLEAELCGQNGRRMVEVTALGRRPDPILSFSRHAGVEPPTHGEAVELTLDLDVQRALEEAFPRDRAGAAVVLDVRDGGVLAILSRPAFDPNEFARGMSRERWQELNSDPRHPLHNRALKAGYPPGSVFKAVTGLAALATRRLGPRERLPGCEGGWQFGNRWFGCHHVHGSLAFEEAMLLSCDVYFYQIGLRAGLDALSEYALALGLGRPTGIELPESDGLVPDGGWYDRRYGKWGWTQGHILNLSIGQGEILATPVQLAILMATLARNGRPVTAHLVRRVGDEIRRPAAPPQRLDMTPAVRRTLLRSLERVVADPRGTGKRARVEGIRVAGKTGTAQNPHGEDHAVFAGFAPFEAPRIAFAVVVENGGHGGEAAAPVAARIIEVCLRDRDDLWAGAEPTSGGAAAVAAAGGD